MALTCCCKKLGRFGISFGISFLQTGASLKKARGSERERVTFECETIYAASPQIFFKEANMELYECLLNFGIIPGSFGLFYTLIEFLVI